MFHVSVPPFVAPAVIDRLTLLLNHVLSSEPIAMYRLRPHAGRCIEITLVDLPARLPAPPVLVFRVTPAGLLESCAARPAEGVDLQLRLDASNPFRLVAQGLLGERPRLELQGNAELATELNWLVDNLRWDVEDDLARVVGHGWAHQIAGVASTLAAALRGAVRRLVVLADRPAGRGAQ
jgi:ubiquinone biosynthesis protein UbiJ